MSMITCPNCDRDNPADRFYCDFCGFRLVAPETPADEPEETEERPDTSSLNPFNLPSRQPGETGDLDLENLDNIPDWLRTGEHQIPAEGKSPSRDSDWLSDLEEITFNVGQTEEVEDWLDVSLPDSDDALPDVADEPLPEPTRSGAEELLQWQDGNSSLDSDALPDWLAGDESSETSTDDGDAAAEPTLTSWLNEEMLDDEPATPTQSDDGLDGLTGFLAELDNVTTDESPLELDESPLDLIDPVPADAEIEAFRRGTDELASQSGDATADSADEFPEAWEELDLDAAEPTVSDAELEAFSFLDSDPELADDTVSPAAPEPEAAESEMAEEPAIAFDLEQDLPSDWTDDSAAELEQAADAGEDLDLTGFTSWLTELQETVQDPALSQDINEADLVTDPDLEISAEEETTLSEEFLEQLDPEPIEEEIEANSNLPDWLSEIQPGDTSILPSLDDAGEEPIAPVEDAIPDWLADIGPANVPQPDDSFALNDDWLADIAPEAPLEDETAAPLAEQPADEAAIVDQEAEAAADWLDELAAARGAEAPTVEDYRDTIVVPPPSKPETGQLEGVPEELAGADLPDWLAGATVDSAASPAPAARPAQRDEDFLGQDDISYEEMPDWLQPEEADFDSALDAALAVQGSEMISAMGGEWAAMLAELPDAAEDEPEEPIELEAAKIPEWLEKLKPDENAPQEVTEPEEVTGVLAGVRGVIDVEPVIALPHQAEPLKQAAVSSQEQQQANLLRQVAIAERAQVIHLGAQRARAIPGWLRLLLAILLIAALLVSQLAPVQDLLDDLLTPPLAPAGADSAAELISSISGQTVLVAVDYTPAMQGELDALAHPLLSQLAAQNNQFVTVSQYPAGAQIARQLTADLTPADLGYLPGEAVGLRQLASCLSAQSCAGLEAASGDIGLILLLTSERTSLQNWMEQVSMTNDNIPFVAGLSQLLSPLAGPYLQSGQLDGAIIGPQSGATVTGDENLQDLARSQSFAILIVVIVLLFGNLIALFTGRQQPATTTTSNQIDSEEAEAEEEQLP